MDYKFTPVTENDVEILRLIRNDCREFMTNNQDMITREQQRDWYQNLDTNVYKIFLFQIPHAGIYHPIGYGIIKLDEDASILTGGIISGYRGYGYGRKIFEELRYHGFQYRNKVRLDVLKSNERAIKLYKSLGFVPTGGDEIIHMEFR